MLLVMALTMLGNLLDCTDDDSWAESIDSTCTDLFSRGLCTASLQSADVDATSSAQVKLSTIRERCPRTCGRCGLTAPQSCTMPRIDASNISSFELADLLLSASSPILVEHALPVLAASLLARHSSLPVAVVTEGGRYRTEATKEQRVSMGDFYAALRNGSLPDDSYIFYELGGLHVHQGGQGVELAGVDVSVESRAVVEAAPELAVLLGRVLGRQRELSPHAMDGRLLLSAGSLGNGRPSHALPCPPMPSHALPCPSMPFHAGSWGNGRPFHAHGPSLFALASGWKRWFVRRPNASLAWQTFEVARGDSLAASDALPAGWEQHVWLCTQSAGQLLWVPDQLQHATLNYAAETDGLTYGFAMVMDDAATFTPLHMAAQAGDASELRALVRGGHHSVNAVAVANGATPLHFAAGLGHSEVVEVLLLSGASVDARAKQGLTPLHVAIAGGHGQVAALLVQHGADLEMRNEHGLTPVELGEQLGKDEAVGHALREGMRRRGAQVI